MIIVIVVLIILLIISIFYCFKFALIILNIQEAIQQSLDILESKYATIGSILQRPLFYDSVEVRQVLREIEKSKEAIHLIALKLTDDFEGEEN
jgi:uncharacterized protein YpmB